MREKDLTEELGSDAFHYQGDYLFVFVYDQERIIKNVAAFENSYFRSKEALDKDIEAIVIQAIVL